jgi:hypothetical protein
VADSILKPRSGQVLVFFALVLPIVLLPVAAYAVDAAVTASAYARLVEVTVRAAEDAAQQVDVAAFRAGGSLVLDAGSAKRMAQDDLMVEPGATVVSVRITGGLVTVATAESVMLPLNFVGPAAITLHASATARIAPGYERPSSRLPLPMRTF